MIDACGATIEFSGQYTVGKSLTTRSGDCIDIRAAHVVLKLDGHSLEGGGNGIGVNIFRGASDVGVEGNGNSGNATVSGFAVGVKTAARDTTIDSIEASGNRRSGILLDRASGVEISQSTFDNNGRDGLRIEGGGANTVASSEAIDNGTYGVWLDGTTGNDIQSVYASANSEAGVYLGCAAKRPFGACGAGASHSNDNFLSGNLGFNSSRTLQKYGIVVGRGSTNNRIADNAMASDGVKDKADANCQMNAWYGNNFATSAAPSGCVE
ncbi:MAG: right-handed parallel beta-helix repeat-containing protein [Candidatus Binataceae bacterium]